MKYLKKFESFDQPMEMSSDYPSVENMKAYVCGFGYSEMECDEMSYDQLCGVYDQCQSEVNEAKKIKKSKVSKKPKPDFLDLDGDGDTEEPMRKAAKEKGRLTTGQKKLPKALQDKILKNKK